MKFLIFKFLPIVTFQNLFFMSSSFFLDDNEISIISLILAKISTVNFSDPPILVLLIFHIISLFFIILTRNHAILSTACFIISGFSILSTPNINKFLNEHYSDFYFSEPYFDESCIFIFIFWTFPIAFNCLVCITIMFFSIVKQAFEKLL